MYVSERYWTWRIVHNTAELACYGRQKVRSSQRSGPLANKESNYTDAYSLVQNRFSFRWTSDAAKLGASCVRSLVRSVAVSTCPQRLPRFQTAHRTLSQPLVDPCDSPQANHFSPKPLFVCPVHGFTRRTLHMASSRFMLEKILVWAFETFFIWSKLCFERNDCAAPRISSQFLNTPNIDTEFNNILAVPITPKLHICASPHPICN